MTVLAAEPTDGDIPPGVLERGKSLSRRMGRCMGASMFSILETHSCLRKNENMPPRVSRREVGDISVSSFETAFLQISSYSISSSVLVPIFSLLEVFIISSIFIRHLCAYSQE